MKKNRKFFMLCICLMSILLLAGACADQAADDPKPTASSTPKTTEIPASAAPQSANTETSAPTATPGRASAGFNVYGNQNGGRKPEGLPLCRNDGRGSGERAGEPAGWEL